MADIIWPVIFLALAWIHGFIGGKWFERAKKDGGAEDA